MAPSSKRVGNREGRRGSRLLRAALFTLAALLAVALVARILAPHVIQRSINHRLDEIPGYGGRVGEVSLHLWRGAYRLTEIRIVKRNGKVREPFFAAKEIDLSIAWRELVRRRFVADIRITDGQLVFLRGPTEEESQLTADSRWQDAINDIFPIDITHLVIDGGVIEFIDTTHEPRVDVAVRDLRVVATGLRNRPAETGQPFPAYIDLSGRTAGDGDLRLYAKLDPLADQAHFQLALEVKKVSLPALNDLMRAYAGIDVSRGQFEVFGQMAMQGGHYEGYVKPFLERVDFNSVDDKRKDLGERIWKEIVVGVAELFKNRGTKQLATRMPFSGDANKMDVSTLATIVNGLRHGFVKALPHAFEGTTHPDDAKSSLPPVAPAKPGT
jgi:uncharacterized protein YhdP